MMRIGIAAGAAAVAATLVLTLAAAPKGDQLAPVGHLPRPNLAAVKPVTETLWGRRVTDNYRYMEALDPATIAWMKAQGAYARRVLDGIAPRAELEKKISVLTASFGFVQGYATFGN